MNIVHIPPRIFGIVRELFPPIGIVSPTGEITFDDDSTQELPAIPGEGDFEKGISPYNGDYIGDVFRRFVFGAWVYVGKNGNFFVRLPQKDVSYMDFKKLEPSHSPNAYIACGLAASLPYNKPIMIVGAG